MAVPPRRHFPGETPEQAMYRELGEEVGLARIASIRPAPGLAPHVYP